MKIPIKVSGQKMNLPSYYEFIAPRSQKFVKFVFVQFEKIKAQKKKQHKINKIYS